MNSNRLVMLLTITLVFSLVACSPKAAQPLAAASQVQGSGQLTITSTYAFTDRFGSYHVIGAVLNDTGNPLTLIELTVEIKDASGNSLLKDENGTSVPGKKFSPILPTLAPGETSPFKFDFDTSLGTPAAFNVTVSGYQAGQAKRASLRVENAQMVDNNNGSLYLSGELVNTSGQWVHVNALAGIVMDSGDKILSTDWAIDYTTDLAPAGDTAQRDRTPFAVSMPNPDGGVSQWAAVYDADTIDAPTDYALAVGFTNSYFDQFGSYHIVGYLTNNANEPLSTRIAAGLYAEDGSVLDASSAQVPLTIHPGAQVPFDVSNFNSVDYSQTQASKVRTFTVQVDLAGTSPATSETIDMVGSGERLIKDGPKWTLMGSATNDSEKNLSGATAVVEILDAQNNLVATSYAVIFPKGEAVTASETINYEVSVYLDPNTDTSGFHTNTILVGEVKE